LRNVVFRAERVSLDVNLVFADGLMIGLVGPDGSGKSLLLRLAAGVRRADSGEVTCSSSAGLAADSLSSADPQKIRESLQSLAQANPHVLLIGPSFSLTDLEFQSRFIAEMHERRRQGSLIILASHDLNLLERHCDEIVALERGQVVERGDPHVVARNYRQRSFTRVRGSAPASPLQPSSRYGDERAEVLEVQLIGAEGKPTSMIASGEQASVRVKLCFRAAVAAPVVGMLILTRIGVNVYGTNTELEGAPIGPCEEGDVVELAFRFVAHLCPQEYTLTVASHDADGTAHDWLDDAIFFTVTDTRYTAGVANLRAQVEVRRLSR
jgi:ABC-type sulfate/molybdate transport systems ATPase subunit